MDEILTLLGQAGITLKLKKCEFSQPRFDYLGHDITPGKLAVALDNTKAFADCTFPRKVSRYDRICVTDTDAVFLGSRKCVPEIYQGFLRYRQALE